MRIGGKAGRAIPDAIAVVLLVEKIPHLEREVEAAGALLELEVDQRISRHALAESVGLVVVVALRADVARIEIQAPAARHRPARARIDDGLGHQRHVLAGDVGAAIRAAAEGRALERQPAAQIELARGARRGFELQAAALRRRQVDVVEYQRAEIDLVAQPHLVSRGAKARATRLVFRAQLARASRLGPQQRARAGGEADLIEGGDAEARGELGVGRPAAAQALAQRELIGRQVVAGAVRRQADVGALQPAAGDQPGAVRDPDIGERVDRQVVLRAGARAEIAAAVEVRLLHVGADRDVVLATAGVEAQLAARQQRSRLDARVHFESGKTRRRLLGAIGQVGGPVVAAAGRRAAQRERGVIATGVAENRSLLARIGHDLRLGERSRQVGVLPSQRHAQVGARLVAARLEGSGDVGLAIFVVAPVAVGVFAGQVERKAQPLAHAPGPRAQLGRAVAPGARLAVALRLARLAALGDDVDGAAACAAAVEHGATAAQDFNPLDRVQRNAGELRRGQFVLRNPDAVDQDQRVLVAGDAEAAQVDLLARRAGVVADMDQAELGQDLGQVGGGALFDVVRGNDGDPHRQVALAVWKTGRRDDDGVVLGQGWNDEKRGNNAGGIAKHNDPLWRLPRRPSWLEWLPGRSPDSRGLPLRLPAPGLPAAQWLGWSASLAYRCGGSTGLEPVSRTPGSGPLS